MDTAKRCRWRRTVGLSLLVLTTFQLSAFAADTSVPAGRGPTPEEIQEADRLAREHLGSQIVDGAKALKGGPDRNLSERVARGETITAAASQLTGTAVNPLFGVMALGMYRYISTPAEARGQLPFYDQPYVWGAFLLVILLMAFNSTICEAMPFLKIPLNALGDMVNKGGAVIVLPVVLHEFAQAFAASAADALASAARWAFPVAYAAEGSVGAGGGWLIFGWVVSLTVGLFAYGVVWVVWNVVDVAILVMPIPFLDVCLKSIRLGAVALVAGAAALNPWLGFAVSLIMVVICCFLAGWAFRLSTMGFVFSTDLLLWRKSGGIDASVGIPAFATATAGRRWKWPARLYGRLRRGPGDALSFAWRPWLIGPRREMDLGRPGDYQGGSTLLYPLVLEGDGGALFRLPPRYRHDSRAVADALGLCGWRDVSIVRGFMKQWRRMGASE